MDELIAGLTATKDNDLSICARLGVAYQTDMRSRRIDYGTAYLEKCRGYEAAQIAQDVVAGRCAMVARHLPLGASLLDVGVGSGAFLRAIQAAGYAASGFDVIPQVMLELQASGQYSDQPAAHSGLTMWDSIEHMENPYSWLLPIRRGVAPNGGTQNGPVGSCLFMSLPVFDDLTAIRESKHYRPGEHLYYWTPDGLVRWMRCRGFRLLEVSTHETDAGREGIGAFAFRRDLPILASQYEVQRLQEEEIHGSRAA